MKAKDLVVRLLDRADAVAFIKKWHYSGKVDPRSQLHFGVFFGDQLYGCLQYGPSVDKRKMMSLLPGMGWNDFLELNRLAMHPAAPKNSESRAIGITLRMIKKAYPNMKMIISFADGTQCGDGTIYRAAGFHLTQIKKNTSMIQMANGDVHCKLVFTLHSAGGLQRRLGKSPGESLKAFMQRVGAKAIPGFQLRYIKILDPAWESKKGFEVLPYSEIDRVGAGMYLGKQRKCAPEAEASMRPASSGEIGGSSPTPALHLPETGQNIVDD